MQDQQSPQTGPPEDPASSSPDGSPGLAAPTMIRRGPRWTPADHTGELRPTLTAFWVRAMAVAVASSGITATAVWCYLAPAYTITIDMGAALNENAIAGPKVDSHLGPRTPDGGSPEDIIKSDYVLSAVLTTVDGITFSEISRRGDPLAWLHDELRVSYSRDTSTMRIGLCSTHVSDLSMIVDTVAETFMSELNLPRSALVGRETIDGGYRLLLTIVGTALGLFVPVLLAGIWGRRRPDPDHCREHLERPRETAKS